MENFTRKQTEALGLLIELYPKGAGIEDPEIRSVLDSIIDRGSGLVELVDYPDSPSGDAYVLTDEGAEALREDAEEQSRAAEQN